MILFSEKEKNEKNDDDNKCFFANTHTHTGNMWIFCSAFLFFCSKFHLCPVFVSNKKIAH